MGNLIVETNKRLAAENDWLRNQLQSVSASNQKLNAQIKQYENSLKGRGYLELAARNFIKSVRNNDGVKIKDLTMLKKAVDKLSE